MRPETNTNFLPFVEMLKRIERSVEDSDSTYFNDLLLLGEMLTKTIIVTLAAGVSDDKERNRYRQLHQIVRINGVGQWSSVLEDILNGVASQSLQNDIRDKEKKELTQRMEKGSWQYDCVEFLFETLRVIGLTLPFEKIPAKVQAKLWFSLFASLRNGTKGHGAILPSTCTKACGPLNNSLKLFVENFFLFKREWAYLHQNLSGKYKVTNLNETIQKFDFLKSNKSFASKYKDGIYVFFEEITNVDLMFSTAEGDDFLYPNGNFKEKHFELLSYISDMRQEGDSTKYLVPTENLPPSETQGLGKLEVLGNSFSNMPPVYNNYVDRESLEEDLVNILLEIDRYPVVTLKGGGGIGKTSLALKVLHKTSENGRFDLILWFSSRDIDLSIEGAKPVRNNILNENDIAKEFVDLLEINEAKTSEEKLAVLSTQMNKSDYGSILFVFDNFETVRNPAELFTWLNTYIRNPNKVLITSRESKTFKADYPIEVLGMEDPECRELITKTSISYGINQLLTDSIVDTIIRESYGHPYVIKLLLAEFSKDKKISNITRVVASKDDILIALFRRTYDWLSPSAKRVFLTLCSWRSFIPQIALEAVLLRADNERIDVDEAVEELRKSSFIEVAGIDEDKEVFLSVPLAAFLFGKNELEVSADKVMILLDRELLMEFGAAQQSDIANGFEPRIKRKFQTIASQISQGKTSLEASRLTLEFIASKYPIGWNLLSKIYEENNDLVKAQHYLREFLKTDSGDQARKEAWQKLADLYESQDDWFNYVNALVEKSSLGNISLFEISEVANEINRKFQAGKLNLDTEVKEKIILKVITLMQNKMGEASSIDYSRMAWLYLSIKNENQAILMTMEGLKKDPNNEYCNNLATRLHI